MAKKSLILKQQRTPKFKVRKYNRCMICGRPRAYMRDFGMCRLCFRNTPPRARSRELPAPAGNNDKEGKK